MVRLTYQKEWRRGCGCAPDEVVVVVLHDGKAVFHERRFTGPIIRSIE
jgi:hypothetical protein